MALGDMALFGAASLALFIIIILSALPLYFAVKILGGKTSLLKVIIVNFIAALVTPIIKSWIGIFGGVVAFIALLFIYKVMFRLGWVRALIAWAGQFIIVMGLVALDALFGISMLI